MEEGRTKICVFPFDLINPSKSNAHWQDTSRKLHEAKVSMLLCCEETIYGPFIVFAHLRKCKTLECRWKTVT